MKISKNILICLVTIIFLSCSLILYIAFYVPTPEISKNSQLIVVLGAGYLKNGKPVLALEKRLDKSIFVWHTLYSNNTILPIMVSGTDKETSIMKHYLLNNGIASNLIIEDREGTNTKATIKNAYQFVNNAGVPIFISQSYHRSRIILYSKLYNDQVIFVPTDRVKIPIKDLLFVVFREFVAISILPYIYIKERILSLNSYYP